jgi:Polyketide cyclase / dehydrase and lipid transport
MARTLSVQQSRVIPVGVDDAFSGTLPIPLNIIFSRWYGPIAPVAEVREQQGPWGTVGQIRLIALRGGGTMREELTSVDPPRSFGYAITAITGPLGLLVDKVDGEWTFAPSGAESPSTTVTWHWNIHAASPVTGPLLSVVGLLWRGYARQSLAALSAELTR